MEVWLGGDGWTASRPTGESEVSDEAMSFGEGDLIGTVGPAKLAEEEIVRRITAQEFDQVIDN
jgi:hypothetical protein